MFKSSLLLVPCRATHVASKRFYFWINYFGRFKSSLFLAKLFDRILWLGSEYFMGLLWDPVQFRGFNSLLYVSINFTLLPLQGIYFLNLLKCLVNVIYDWEYADVH